MKPIKKQNTFLILLFSVLISVSGATYSQTLEETITFAGDAFERGEYGIAAKAYQRAYFFAPKEQLGDLAVRIGDSYFAMQDYAMAKSFFRKAVHLVRGDSLKAEVLFRKVTCELMQKSYLMALMDLKSFKFSLTAEQERIKNFLLGISYFGKEDFAASKAAFMQVTDPGEEEKRQQLEAIFSNRRSYLSPNPKTAMWLSIAFPGLGQLYAGDIKNSLNSLLLTSGLTFLGVYVSLQYSLIDGIVAVAPWMQRYYTGGYTHAEDIAFKKRQQKRDKVFRRIYDLLLRD